MLEGDTLIFGRLGFQSSYLCQKQFTNRSYHGLIERRERLTADHVIEQEEYVSVEERSVDREEVPPLLYRLESHQIQSRCPEAWSRFDRAIYTGSLQPLSCLPLSSASSSPWGITHLTLASTATRQQQILIISPERHYQSNNSILLSASHSLY